MEPLTMRQQQVLDFIISYLDDYACPPTLREISQHIDAKGTVTAIRHVNELERKGYIHRREGSSRSIVVTGRGASTSVPIVGKVKAGPPMLAFEDIEGYCNIDINWVRDKGCFFLRVDGDSMIEDHILDGNLALIRPQETADNGDIVVALIDDEATLKRFYREGDQIRLEARNPTFPPIILSADKEVTIIGKAIKIVRDIE